MRAAEDELVDAAQYYESQRVGLGREFLDAVSDAEAMVQRNSETWAFYDAPVRSCRVMRFPYRLFYVERTECILIVAVGHLTRKPGYWKGRIEE